MNRMKLMNVWRVFMNIAKIGKIRKYLTFYMQIFERDLDDKDAILQMLDIDIREDEDHFILNNLLTYKTVESKVYLKNSKRM